MSTRRWPKVLAWIAGSLAVVLVLTVLGGVWFVRRSFPQTEGTVAVAGISATVDVRRDAAGIPHLYADTADDLMFAQGYVHAQDRFWEMDFRRHVTAGRLAEMFGESQVETDAVIRTMGWRQVAEAELALLSEETIAALEAYAAGVNAYLQDRSPTQLSLEYAVLGLQNGDYEIEPWQPADSVAWLKAMAWDLRSNVRAEIDRALISAEVGAERTEQLYPDYPYDRNQPILTSGAVVDGVFEQDATPAPVAPGDPVPVAATDAVRAVRASLDAVPPLLGPGGAGLGSNSWALSGSRTTTGMPLLANDPHLGASMPAIWYQMGLHCRTVSASCPFDVAGYTFSGSPGVVIGHNADIAWGFTNLNGDVADLYLEQVRGDSVVVDGEEQPLDVRTETIEVAGADPVTITVRSSSHGPLLSEASEQIADVGAAAPAGEGQDGLEVALRWTALDPGLTADAILAMNTASTFDEFREAAQLFEVPAQNLLYADTDGNIGYQSPGRFPIRGAGDGRWPAPGWDSSYDWTGYIPSEALPTTLNPPEGYISTANQPVLDLRTYAYWLGEDWAYGSRGQRIVELIEGADGPLDAAAMSAIHMDNFNDMAEFLAPELFAVEGLDGVAAEAQQLLGDWDYQQDEDSAAAAYYNAVWAALLSTVFDDELGDDLAAGGGSRWFETVRTLWDDPGDPWWDDVATPETETRDDALSTAMQTGADDLVERLGDDPSAWTWGELHTLELVNASFGTSGIAPVEWLFNRGPVRTSGGSSIVNATSWSAGEGYEVASVPSMRMVIDLSDLDASTWVNLTGSSGHAFHPHYWDQTELWRTGETRPFAFTPDAVEEASVNTLTLEPAS